jgi:cytosine/adenosine deaminase-related metal-dependent hydrolase
LTGPEESSRPAGSPRLVLRGLRWPGDIAIVDDHVVAVGSIAPEPGDEVVRCDGDLATAGLVNTHHHLYQWITRGTLYA